MTRDTALRFSNGHFTMIGLRTPEGAAAARLLYRAIIEDHLEFLSIKVQEGPIDIQAAAHSGGRQNHQSGRKPTARS